MRGHKWSWSSRLTVVKCKKKSACIVVLVPDFLCVNMPSSQITLKGWEEDGGGVKAEGVYLCAESVEKLQTH